MLLWILFAGDDWPKEEAPNGLFSCSDLVALIGRYEACWSHTSSELHFPSFSVSKCAIDLQMSFAERGSRC
jgi:hypothetical protein